MTLDGLSKPLGYESASATRVSPSSTTSQDIEEEGITTIGHAARDVDQSNKGEAHGNRGYNEWLGTEKLKNVLREVGEWFCPTI